MQTTDKNDGPDAPAPRVERYIVKAQEREGFHGFFSAGRHWPSSAPSIVEVHDQDHDPVPFDQRKIGKLSLATLVQEKFLLVGRDGGGLVGRGGFRSDGEKDGQEHDEAKAELVLENARLTRQLAELDQRAGQRIDELEKELDEAKTKLRAKNKPMLDELDQLKQQLAAAGAKQAELQSQLAAIKPPQ